MKSRKAALRGFRKAIRGSRQVPQGLMLAAASSRSSFNIFARPKACPETKLQFSTRKDELLADADFFQGRLTVFQLGTPQTKPLGQEQAKELAVGEEITPPKTSGLLTEPVKPL